MSATEKVINDLNTSKFMLSNTQITLTRELRVRIGLAINSAVDLLKEQDNCENCAVAIEDRQPVVRCRDCKHAVLTSRGEAKYCQFWQEDEDGNFGGDPLYLDGDFFCAGGERTECE